MDRIIRTCSVFIYVHVFESVQHVFVYVCVFVDRFAMSSAECYEEMVMLCDKLTRQCLLAGQYDVIENLCKPNHQLHVSA